MKNSKIRIALAIAFCTLQNFAFALNNSPKENKLLVSQLEALVNDLGKLSIDEAIDNIPKVNHPEIKFIHDILKAIDDCYESIKQQGLLEEILSIEGKPSMAALFEEKLSQARQTTAEVIVGIDLITHMGPTLGPKIERKLLKIKDKLIEEKNFFDNLEPRNLFKKLAILKIFPKIKNLNNDITDYLNDVILFELYNKTNSYFINHRLEISKIPSLLEAAIDEWCEEKFLRIQVRKAGWNQILKKQELARNNHIYALLERDAKEFSKVIADRLKINDLAYSIVQSQFPTLKEIRKFFSLIVAFDYKYKKLIKLEVSDRIDRLKSELPEYIAPYAKLADLKQNPKWLKTLDDFIYEPVGFKVEHEALKPDEASEIPASPEEPSPKRSRSRILRENFSFRDRRSMKLPSRPLSSDGAVGDKNFTPPSSTSPSPSQSPSPSPTRRGRIRNEETTPPTSPKAKFYNRSSTEIGGSIEKYRRPLSSSPTRQDSNKIEVEKTVLVAIDEAKENSQSRKKIRRERAKSIKLPSNPLSDSKNVEQTNRGKIDKTLPRFKKPAHVGGGDKIEKSPLSSSQEIDLSQVKRVKKHYRDRSKSV